MERDRGQRAMQKACQSCCLNGLNDLQDSSFKINKVQPTN